MMRVMLALVLLAPVAAPACDDVRPPEGVCPPHQVWHLDPWGGSRGDCVDRAPSDCENGWRGIPGPTGWDDVRGQCIVHLAADGVCPNGLAVRSADVCFRTDTITGTIIGKEYVRYDPPRLRKKALGYATDARRCPDDAPTETVAVCVEYDEPPEPWIRTRHRLGSGDGDGPRRPSLADHLRRPACAGGGVDLALGALALLALTRRQFRRMP